MTPGARLGVCLALAMLVITTALAWLQWPASGSDDETSVASDGAATRDARISALREQIRRELQRLQQARQDEDRTEAELRDLEQSLERTRERVEHLRESVDSAAGNGS